MINPSILILLGGTAAKALLTSTQGITQLRKKWHQYNSLNLEQLNEGDKVNVGFNPNSLVIIKE